ncbi:MAG TPA: hypothetical protein VMT19_12955 [Thermoanaerobaculaceae bacterium]|nr:hypothetical protein [Thermoanaerobaculaceae bacterium]
MVSARIGCSLRFWGSDLRNGSPIARHLADVKGSFRDPRRARENAAARLRELLRHACSTTSHYRRWQGEADLSGFPVLPKRVIQENPAAFLSSALEPDALLTVSTSGSYGAPMRFRWTPETYARRRAELLYFSSWVGFRVGAPFAQVTVHPSGSARLRRLNGFLVDPSVIDGAWLEATRRLLTEERIEFVIGYPSSIGPLAEYCRTRGDDPAAFRVRAVVSSSEALRRETREVVHTAFGCTVLDRYGANELGILAQECPGHAALHVNVAGLVVELLARDGDAPVAPGEAGRVVVTDLFSYAMPLIRYDTGDLAVAGPDPCPCGLGGPTLARVEGRLVEQVRDPGGGLVNPLAIGGCTRGVDGILQYQFVQRGPAAYLVRIQVGPTFRTEGVLHDRFRELLGPGATIEIRRVESIPPLPSGKRPTILNELVGASPGSRRSG